MNRLSTSKQDFYKAVYDNPNLTPKTASIFGYAGALLFVLYDIFNDEESINFPEGFAYPA